MANLKASKKSIKVIEKKTENNHEYKAQVKNYIRKCDKAITEDNKELATSIYKNVQKSIDVAVSKGLMKKNTADRQKSRLSNKIKEMK